MSKAKGKGATSSDCYSQDLSNRKNVKQIDLKTKTLDKDPDPLEMT